MRRYAGTESGEKFQDLDRFVSSANNEHDLADAYHDTAHIDEQERIRGARLAAEEEQILRCLGTHRPAQTFPMQAPRFHIEIAAYLDRNTQ
jgi:hypothetical protein